VKILVIPEDQRLDGHIVKPVIEALLADIPLRARVDVLAEPRLRGASHVFSEKGADGNGPPLLETIMAENPMVDCFVLVIDRDCDRDGHEAKVAAREQKYEKLIGCLAVQELEVWMLALHKDKLEKAGTRWREVREHCDPKERWAAPLLEELGSEGPGGGRKKAMRALSGNLKTLMSLCDEVRDLRDKLARLK
jgi:hypothetical protein